MLRQAFERIGLEWPDPPVICTAALARALLPLQRKRGLGVLADALGIEVALAHRALADAETCARVLCALFPRLCANAATVADALALLRAGARKRPLRPGGRLAAAPGGPARGPARPATPLSPSSRTLPRDPGVYLFRDDAGRVLYVGKSVSIRSRARAHFAPSSPAGGVDRARHRRRLPDDTRSELGALDAREPADQGAQAARQQAADPSATTGSSTSAAGSTSRSRSSRSRPTRRPGTRSPIGPVRGRRLALELVEQLDSLFGLRHCGRRLPRREHPSAYGQMGRCLSPCLGDLDPNLYRRRLDEVLRLFVRRADGPGQPLLRHVDDQMRAAAAQQRYERAESLRRRAGRLRAILGRLDGVLEATHARPRLLLAPPSDRSGAEAFWLAGGRLVDCGPLATTAQDLAARTAAACARGRRASSAPTCRPTRSTRCGLSAPGWPRIRTRRSWRLRPRPDVTALPRPAGARPRAVASAKGSSTTTASISSAPTETS